MMSVTELQEAWLAEIPPGLKTRAPEMLYVFVFAPKQHSEAHFKGFHILGGLSGLLPSLKIIVGHLCTEISGGLSASFSLHAVQF